MKLTRKFLFLVAVLLLAFAVTTFASLRALRTLNVALGQVIDQDVQRLVVVTDVRRLFRTMVVLERERILEKDAPRFAEQAQSMGQLRRQWLEKIGAYEALMPEADRSQVTTLRQVYERWVQLDDRVFAVSAQNREADAYALARKHTDDPVSWEDLIAKLVASNEDRLRNQVAAAGIAYRKGRTVVLGAALAAALYALIAGMAVLRGIQRVTKDHLALSTNLESLVDHRTRELRSREESMRLMLDNVVRDITKQVESERVEAEQRELTRMVQRIVRDKTGFLDFLAESHEMVGRLLAREADTEEGLRLVHTLKGNCAVYGLLSISDLCDTIEARCAEEARGVSPEDSRELGRMWEGVTAKVRELAGGAGAHGIEIDDEEYGTIVRSILRGAPRRELLERIVAWRLEPTRIRLQRLADQTTNLAQRLGKAPVVVAVEDNGLRLPAPLWQRFWSATVHVVRNAVDHGLENPDDRAGLGKGPSRIALRTKLEEGHVVFECEDDGKGIDWDTIQSRGRALGLPCETHDDLVSLMMRDGLSTREVATSTSARGVGMSAVREACESMGGRVRVRSEKGRGTVLQFWFPRSTMIDDSASVILTQPITNSLGPGPVLRFLRSVTPPGASVKG